jgi:hypothetical protein
VFSKDLEYEVDFGIYVFLVYLENKKTRIQENV